MRKLSNPIFLLMLMLLVFLSGCGQPVSTSPPIQEKVDVEVAPPPESESLAEQAVQEPLPENEETEKTTETTEMTQTTDPVAEHPPFEYPDAIRGIYVTSHSAGGAKFPELLNLVKTTDLNAMVIDIKDDHGWITYKRDDEMASFSKPFMKDPKQILQTLSDNKIYPIARIVVFKDSVLAADSPHLSFKSGGQVWKNRRGEAFVNPFLKEVWEYNVAIAKEAAKMGFQEIQFDYVRFPEGFETRDKALTYGMGTYTQADLEPRLVQDWEKQKEQWERKHQEIWAMARETQPPAETLANETPIGTPVNNLTAAPRKPQYDAVAARVTAVTDFVEYAKKELEPYNVKVSVDIFGYTATLPEAPGIGQNFLKISSHVDVICSMIYPSHWGPGYFNIPKPDVEPYRLVQEYAKMENEKLAQLENPPISRPWIQDFTAPWLGKGNYIPYGKREVELQIKALNEAGIKEFLVWNAGNNYTPNVDYTP